MEQQQPGGLTLNVITHVHTDASSAETSELNDRIIAGLQRCTGGRRIISWAECFTPIAKLARRLEPRPGRLPVHLILVTDHMRRRSHSLPERHLRAAAQEQRLALGAELATRCRDADGVYRQGPEILALGGARPVPGPHGSYYGLSQKLLDELYATCLDDEGRELCTRRAGRLLCQRQILHALSHPLDGHVLSLEGTLAVVSEFPYIETVNGGFSAQSARMLEAFIQLQNALVAGAELPAEVLSPLGQRLVAHIRRHGRPLRALGGSDAHSHNFARVLTQLDLPPGCQPEELTPGDFFARLLQLAERPLPSQGPGAVEASLHTAGRAASLSSLLADVGLIILRNVRFNLPRCQNPYTWSKIALTTLVITNDELRIRRVSQRRRVQQLKTEFDPLRLLPQLQPATAKPAPGPRRLELTQLPAVRQEAESALQRLRQASARRA